MRSTPRDAGRVVSVSTMLPIPNAASAQGAFSDGTPWNMTRTSTGNYEINFDPRLIPMNGSAGPIQNARITYIFQVIGPGNILVHCLLFDGTDVNATFDLIINCIDTRI